MITIVIYKDNAEVKRFHNQTSDFEAVKYLLRIQPQSIHYATTYGGYRIETIDEDKTNKPQSIIKFISDNEKHYAVAMRHNDAFWEITEGKNKGNLVHVFDVVYEQPLNPEADDVPLDELQAASDYLERMKKHNDENC